MSDWSLFVSDGSQTGRERRRGIYASPNNSTQTREPGSVIFTMDEIYKATRNFSPSFKIGQGGFGTVYKGRLQDGTLVAIKRAKKVGNEHLLVYVFTHDSSIKMSVYFLHAVIRLETGIALEV